MFRLVFEPHDGRAVSVNSKDKREPARGIETAEEESLKALDLKKLIREADMTVNMSSDWDEHVDELLRLSLQPLETRAFYSHTSLPESSLDTLPGQPPFVRGGFADTYAKRPWTVRQYGGFGSARETNQRFKWLLARGQTGISIAFDLPTQRGFDSDAPEVLGEVGRTGVAIDSVDDFKALLEGISLRDISVSMTINSTSLPILAAYIVAAEECGYAEKELRGTIQNDPLKEYIARNTYVFPPRASLFLAGELIRHCAFYMPKFHPISVSGYHFKEMGANPVQEVSFMIANAFEYIDECIRLGISVEKVAPRFSFFLGVGTNVLIEAAKLRAARSVWANLLTSQYRAKDPDSRRMRMHCQTSGVDLTADMVLGNIGRVALQALAAILGGTQSLHTNAYDEAHALPSQEAIGIALQTQEILRKETGLSDVIDPLGGAYYVEALTEEISDRCTSLICSMKRQGGMMAAIENGWAKRAILISAIKHQAHQDQKERKRAALFDALETPASRIEDEARDDHAIAVVQKERLSRIRESRDGAQVERLLARVSETAAAQKCGLVEVVKEAVRARATIGEVRVALARIYGEHRAAPIIQRGIYAKELEKHLQATDAATSLQARFRTIGGPPRLLVVKLGQDGHDRGATTVASALTDLGWIVTVTPLFSNAEDVFRQCSEVDFDILGISTLSDGHDDSIRRLFTLLKSLDGKPLPVVVCGGVVSAKSSAELAILGVSRIFRPGTSILHINATLSNLAEKRRRRLHNQI